MGVEQSKKTAQASTSATKPSLQQQLDTHNAYTAASFSKPNTIETVAAVSADSPSAVIQDDPYKVTVISTGDTSNQNADPELQQLIGTPQFVPIISLAADPKWGSGKYRSNLEPLDTIAILTICSEQQEFLKNRHKQVAENERVLAQKVNATQVITSHVLNRLAVHANDTRYMELQLREVSRINATIEAINESLASILQLADVLNHALPQEEAMEPVTELINKDKRRRLADASKRASKEFLSIEQNIVKNVSVIENILKTPERTPSSVVAASVPSSSAAAASSNFNAKRLSFGPSKTATDSRFAAGSSGTSPSASLQDGGPT